jgi:Fic family protein
MPAAAMQPLLPDPRALAPLLEQAAALIAEGHRLESAAGKLGVSLRPLLRAMNSYYTNKIEGQQTRPADLERALHHQFDADATQARKQRLALAHIETEAELEGALPTTRGELYAPAFVQRIHADLYGRLPPPDRVTDDQQQIEPGVLRRGLVTAGRHLAPDPKLVPALLGAWQRRYAELPGLEHALVGAVCAHHRLLWIHPFPDGNGRAARLHTHLALTFFGVTQGLWSPLRGMARDQEAYYARLNNADLPRRNDLDGRGPLSQEELVNFACWLLELCLDQATFMRGLLALDTIKGRLQELLLSLASRPWSLGSEPSVIKIETLEALHYAAISGSVERSRFMAMTGLSPRVARRVLASLLSYGVLESPTPRAPVAFAVPFKSLRFLFPRLWPEAEADSEL